MPSLESIALLGEAAPWSARAATALAELASGPRSLDYKLRTSAADKFWASGNFEPIFKSPKRYCGLVAPKDRGAPPGVFLSVDQACHFTKTVVCTRKDPREALNVMYALLELGPKTEPAFGAIGKKLSQSFSQQLLTIYDYISSLTPEQIRGLKLDKKQDACIYEALIAKDKFLSTEQKFAIADVIVEAVPRLDSAEHWLGAIMAHLPFDSHPKCYQPFVERSMWEPLAAALFDWAHGLSVTREVQHNFQPVLEGMSDIQFRQMMADLPKIGKRLAKRVPLIWPQSAVNEALTIVSNTVTKIRNRNG